MSILGRLQSAFFNDSLDNGDGGDPHKETILSIPNRSIDAKPGQAPPDHNFGGIYSTEWNGMMD